MPDPPGLIKMKGGVCPPPDSPNDEADRTGPDGSTTICIKDVLYALKEIEEWIGGVRTALECFPENYCVSCPPDDTKSS